MDDEGRIGRRSVISRRKVLAGLGAIAGASVLSSIFSDGSGSESPKESTPTTVSRETITPVATPTTRLALKKADATATMQAQLEEMSKAGITTPTPPPKLVHPVKKVIP